MTPFVRHLAFMGHIAKKPLQTFLYFLLLVLSLTGCSSAEKEAEQLRDQEILAVFAQAIKSNEVFDREYRHSNSEGKAEIEADYVQFEGEKLFPKFDHAVDIILGRRESPLLGPLLNMVAQYKSGREAHFFVGLARIYRKHPDPFVESYEKLPYAYQVTVFDALQNGWKDLLRHELHNDWTIELSNRLRKLRPLKSR